MTARSVAALELRTAARSSRLRVIVTSTTIGLCAVCLAVYALARRIRHGADVSATLTANVGRLLSHVVLFLVLVALCVAIPPLAAASIAEERERATLVPLLASQARPSAIVIGKMLAIVARILCMLVAVVPFLAIAHLLGGVSPRELIRGMASIFASSVLMASLCVAASSVMRRASGALVAGYAMIGVLVVGSLAIFGAQAVILGTTNAKRINHTAIALNPFVTTADAISGPTGTEDRFLTPFAPFEALIGDRITLLDEIGLITDGFRVTRQQRFAERRSRRLWVDGIVVSLAVSVGAGAFAARRLRLPDARDRR